MSIPSQLPQLIAAARSGALQALALQAGQMLEGKVIGPAPNGGTQVQIGGQMLNLVLPLLAKAGETLKFEVQGNGGQVRLALQALQPATVPSSPPQAPAPLPAQAGALPLPAAEPAVSAAPRQPIAQSASMQGPAATLPQSSPAPQAAVQQSPAAPSQPSQPSAAGAPQAAAAPSATVQTQPAPVPTNPMPAAPAPTVSAPASPTLASPTLPSAASAMPASSPMPAAIPAAVAAPVPSALATAVPGAQAYAAAPPKGAAAPGQPVSAPLAVSPGGVDARGLPPTTVPTTPTPATPVPAAAATTAPMPTTPQAALAQMVQTALPRQDGIASLTTALTSIAGKVMLPEPVVRAAQQVLAGRVNLGKLDAGTLQRAVLASGVFQEAALTTPGATVPTPQRDMKSALLALRQTLTTWLGQQAPLTATTQLPPPLRGHVPRARTAEAPPLDPQAAPEEVGKQLLERTEAALSRVRLHQNASLPDPVARGAEWSMDLPVLIGSQQTLLQLQIHRDEENAGEATAERGWQLRFAVNLAEMGEVGAQVSLRGRATGVMLWATERATSEALEAELGALRDTLAAVGLQPGAILVRHGEPPAPPPAPSGHLVDAST